MDTMSTPLGVHGNIIAYDLNHRHPLTHPVNRKNLPKPESAWLQRAAISSSYWLTARR
jgi:hypothetical protein